MGRRGSKTTTIALTMKHRLGIFMKIGEKLNLIAIKKESQLQVRLKIHRRKRKQIYSFLTIIPLTVCMRYVCCFNDDCCFLSFVRF